MLRTWVLRQLHDNIENWRSPLRQTALVLLLLAVSPVRILRAWRHPEQPLPGKDNP